MKKNVLTKLIRYASLICLLLLAGKLHSQNHLDQASDLSYTRAEKNMLRKCRGNVLAFYHGSQMKEFTRLMNLARIDPVLLEKYVSRKYGESHSALLPNEMLQKRHRVLKNEMGLLRPSVTLHLGSFYHASFGGLKGSVGHQHFETRLMASMNFSVWIPGIAAGENCEYGSKKGIDIFTNLINSYGHRMNILNPRYMRVGMSKKYHSGYRYNTVSMFSGPKFHDFVFHKRQSQSVTR